jgi:hypothetical protein
MALSKTIGGIVRNGVIIPDVALPEETRVDIRVATTRLTFTPEEQAEFEAWNRASHQALATFERMVEGEPTGEVSS